MCVQDAVPDVSSFRPLLSDLRLSQMSILSPSSANDSRAWISTGSQKPPDDPYPPRWGAELRRQGQNATLFLCSPTAPFSQVNISVTTHEDEIQRDF